MKRHFPQKHQFYELNKFLEMAEVNFKIKVNTKTTKDYTITSFRSEIKKWLFIKLILKWFYIATRYRCGSFSDDCWDVRQCFVRQLFGFCSTIEEQVVFRSFFRTCHWSNKTLIEHNLFLDYVRLILISTSGMYKKMR